MVDKKDFLEKVSKVPTLVYEFNFKRNVKTHDESKYNR